MRLYTINATPVRESNSDISNKNAIALYPTAVEKVMTSKGIYGFTIYRVQGYWQGKSEVSFKIEVALDDNDAHDIPEIAEILRAMYNQDSVMITSPDNNVTFIGEE